MNIAIFGGSFDPLHNGHINIIKHSLNRLDINKLVVMPTYISAFKDKYYLLPSLRYKILKKSLFRYKKVFVSPYEVNSKKIVYTYDSVLFLQKKLKINKIYLIIGADNVIDIYKWYNFKKLNKKVHFVVASRDNIKIYTKLKYILLKTNNKSSSSSIRKKQIIKDVPLQAKWVLNSIKET
jgi:nicotinate-nucleotide adenylyltransferase